MSIELRVKRLLAEAKFKALPAAERERKAKKAIKTIKTEFKKL